MPSLSGKVISFPYGATSSPYSVKYPHRGDDYPLVNEPVIVADIQIGISGQTGDALGPHTHVQAGHDEWAQQTIPPAPYTNQPGIVVKIGAASEWGNYVCVRVGDVNVFYCHLSRIDVKKGDTIGDEMSKFNQGDAKNISHSFFGQDIGQVESQVGQDWKSAMYNIIDSKVIDSTIKLNDGDAINIIAAFKLKVDKSKLVGQTFKAVLYNYIFPNIGNVDTDFELINQPVYVKK